MTRPTTRVVERVVIAGMRAKPTRATPDFSFDEARSALRSLTATTRSAKMQRVGHGDEAGGAQNER
jgi:hypothetical protein